MKHLFGSGRRTSGSTSNAEESPVKEQPGSEGMKKRGSHPVDLDELYDQGSETSVGDITETTVSFETTPEKQRMSALTHTMAEKQLGISESFIGMIHSMTKLVAEAEGSSNKKDTSIKRSKACKEMEEHAAAMAKKQARIAQQFETLVFRLEQEVLDRDATNQRLTRQLKMARMMLKDEAGIELEDVSATKKKTQPPRSPSKRPPRTVRRGTSSQSSPALSIQSSEIFSIKEISFSNTVVDVSEMNLGQHLEDVTLSEDTNEEDKQQLNVGDNLRLIL
jgi:hypothetical protein